MSEKVRTFIAISLTAEAIEALRHVQDTMRRRPDARAARWTAPENIHLTLKFLGDVPEEDLAVIAETLRAACAEHRPFRITLTGLGCFPSTRQPRIVWVGLTGDTTALLALQKAVEQAVAHLGYPPEQRAFSPHLTIARIQSSAKRPEIEALGRAVERADVGELAHLDVQSVHLIRSDLRPNGPIYTELASTALCSEAPTS